ncbi:hypothetical protein [Haloglomus salinum]|uniref:hypothetical protein n=1 Tax=Haloglomus salinum TaxID=2962673 RepID=UPI0020C976B4|nr:hypothetical protein [Haloglomus salinum]
MPNPDTETLAARLRAVERALTDEDIVPDPPMTPSADTPAGTGDASPRGEHRDEPAPAVDRRLCRLEAAVQALRAALDDEPDATPSDAPATGEPPFGVPRDEELPSEVPRGEEPRAETAGSRDTAREDSGTAERLDPPRRVPDSGHWPDDLATE